MKITKHGYARFKQRQNLKNSREMMRRFSLAVERGTLLPGKSSMPNTLCIAHDGYKYIVSDDKESLITVLPVKRRSRAKKRFLIDQLRMWELTYEEIEEE